MPGDHQLCQLLLAQPLPQAHRAAGRGGGPALPAPEAPEDSLEQCLDRLSPDLRVAVQLYYYEGYSSPEIAALLHKSESAVRTRLMRARRLLRDYLEEKGNSYV